MLSLRGFQDSTPGGFFPSSFLIPWSLMLSLFCWLSLIFFPLCIGEAKEVVQEISFHPHFAHAVTQYYLCANDCQIYICNLASLLKSRLLEGSNEPLRMSNTHLEPNSFQTEQFSPVNQREHYSSVAKVKNLGSSLMSLFLFLPPIKPTAIL